jgi:polycystin 1L2
MIANAMFFTSSDEEQAEGTAQLGVIRISTTTIIVSLIGISITTPPIMFITFAFRKSRPPPRKKKKEGKNKQNSKVAHSDKGKINEGIEVDDVDIEDNKDGTEDDTEKKDAVSDDLEEKIDLEKLLENNSLPLPHWVRRIAWFIVFMSVLTSAFFLLLYSMEWGISKSEEWLSSFLLSFLESLLFVDPLKVKKS